MPIATGNTTTSKVILADDWNDLDRLDEYMDLLLQEDDDEDHMTTCDVDDEEEDEEHDADKNTTKDHRAPLPLFMDGTFPNTTMAKSRRAGALTLGKHGLSVVPFLEHYVATTSTSSSPGVHSRTGGGKEGNVPTLDAFAKRTLQYMMHVDTWHKYQMCRLRQELTAEQRVTRWYRLLFPTLMAYERAHSVLATGEGKISSIGRLTHSVRRCTFRHAEYFIGLPSSPISLATYYGTTDLHWLPADLYHRLTHFDHCHSDTLVTDMSLLAQFASVNAECIDPGFLFVHFLPRLTNLILDNQTQFGTLFPPKLLEQEHALTVAFWRVWRASLAALGTLPTCMLSREEMAMETEDAYTMSARNHQGRRHSDHPFDGTMTAWYNMMAPPTLTENHYRFVRLETPIV